MNRSTHWTIPILLLALGVILLYAFTPNSAESEDPPYPPSEVVESIIWDFGNLMRGAPGSDLWPITWGADGNLYTSWGDGVGFGARDFNEQRGPERTSLGFSRIEGPPASFTATNIWGGKNPENPTSFVGKSMGMISVDGVLYAWVNVQNASPPDFKLAWSDDLGAHWQLVEWKFSADRFVENTFLNFGKDYAGARDGLVYIYGFNRETSVGVELARVSRNRIKDRSAYEWYVGLDPYGKPIWTANFLERRSVFEDGNKISLASVSYNPGIKRYLLVTAHGKWENSIGKLGVFDAPEPWGPWTTVEYNKNWGGFKGWQNGYHIPTKTPDWMSPDGKTIHVIFSGQDELDSFNVVRGTLILRKPS